MYKKNAFSLCFGSRLSFARICISKGSRETSQVSKPLWAMTEQAFRHLNLNFSIWTQQNGMKSSATYIVTYWSWSIVLGAFSMSQRGEGSLRGRGGWCPHQLCWTSWLWWVCSSLSCSKLECTNWLISCLQFPRSEICNFAKPWVSKPWYTNSVSGYNWKHFFEHSHWC